MKIFDWFVTCLWMVGLLVTGCGVLDDTHVNVRNLIKSNNANQSSRYDPVTLTNQNDIATLQLYDAKGHKIALKLGTPVLVVAYWCPDCHRTLRLLYQNRAKFRVLPIIVSAGFQPGTTLKQAVNITSKEFSTLGINEGFTVYYLPKQVNPDIVPIFPSLFFQAPTGATLRLSGEHILSVWQKALNE